MIELVRDPRWAGSGSPATELLLARIIADDRGATNPSCTDRGGTSAAVGWWFLVGVWLRPHNWWVVGALGVLSGGVLLSHTLACAVPSALGGLTSGFGMGPGVSLSLWPP